VAEGVGGGVRSRLRHYRDKLRLAAATRRCTASSVGSASASKGHQRRANCSGLMLGAPDRCKNKELHVEVVARERGAWCGVAVEVDRRFGEQCEAFDTALFRGLAQGGGNALVFGVDVAAHLQPELCLCMQAKEHHGAGWVKDDRSGP